MIRRQLALITVVAIGTTVLWWGVLRRTPSAGTSPEHADDRVGNADASPRPAEVESPGSQLDVQRVPTDTSSTDAKARHAPAVKEKDRDMVTRIAARGKKDSKANVQEYVGWTFQQVLETFGRPDSSKQWDGSGEVTIYYWTPGTKDVQLMFRLKNAVVTGVWP